MWTRKKKVILLAALLFLSAVLLVWRLYPHSLDKIVLESAASVESLSCNAVVTGVESGELFMDSYLLPSAARGEVDFEAVMDILSGTKYRQDLRNLLPWSIDSVDDGGTHNGKSVNVSLAWGDAERKYCYIMFHSDSVAAVDTGADGFLIYHPTDRGALDELTEYIQTHGTKK